MMTNNLMISNLEYEHFGCIIFKNPNSGNTPGVAVYTYENTDIQKAPRRSVHFGFTEEFLIVEEFGVNYYSELNSAEEYIQISETDARTLREKGRVEIPHYNYNLFRQGVKN